MKLSGFSIFLLMIFLVVGNNARAASEGEELKTSRTFHFNNLKVEDGISVGLTYRFDFSRSELRTSDDQKKAATEFLETLQKSLDSAVNPLSEAEEKVILSRIQTIKEEGERGIYRGILLTGTSLFVEWSRFAGEGNSISLSTFQLLKRVSDNLSPGIFRELREMTIVGSSPRKCRINLREGMTSEEFKAAFGSGMIEKEFEFDTLAN